MRIQHYIQGPPFEDITEDAVNASRLEFTLSHLLVEEHANGMERRRRQGRSLCGYEAVASRSHEPAHLAQNVIETVEHLPRAGAIADWTLKKLKVRCRQADSPAGAMGGRQQAPRAPRAATLDRLNVTMAAQRRKHRA